MECVCRNVKFGTASTCKIPDISNFFWTSNISLLMLIALHYARESSLPRDFQRRLVHLYEEDSEIDRSEKARNQETERKVMVYDSGRRHDNLTGLPFREKDKVEDGLVENAGVDDIAFEDEHIIVFNKKAKSLKPRTVSLFCWERPRYSGAPFSDRMLGQFILAAFWQCVQVYVFYRIKAESMMLIQVDRKCKLIVAVGFLLPSALMVISLAICMDSIQRAVRYPSALSSDAHGWVLNVLQPLMMLSMVIVPVVWSGVALA